MLTCHVAEPSRPPRAWLLRARCSGSLGSRKRPETGIVEVERTVSLGGTISLGSRVVLVAWMLAGRPSGCGSRTVHRCCSSGPCIGTAMGARTVRGQRPGIGPSMVELGGWHLGGKTATEAKNNLRIVLGTRATLSVPAEIEPQTRMSVVAELFLAEVKEVGKEDVGHDRLGWKSQQVVPAPASLHTGLRRDRQLCPWGSVESRSLTTPGSRR